MDAEAVRSCTLELKEAEQTLATLGRRLTEELDRKDFLLSNPSDWKTQSSSVGNKRKVDHIDANALRLKRARKDAPDQEQYEQARNHLDFPDEHEEYFHPTWVCLMNTWSNTCTTFTQIWPTLLGTSRWSTSGSFATMACTTMNTMLIKITTYFDTSLSSHSTRWDLLWMKAGGETHTYNIKSCILADWHSIMAEGAQLTASVHAGSIMYKHHWEARAIGRPVWFCILPFYAAAWLGAMVQIIIN